MSIDIHCLKIQSQMSISTVAQENDKPDWEQPEENVDYRHAKQKNEGRASNGHQVRLIVSKVKPYEQNLKEGLEAVLEDEEVSDALIARRVFLINWCVRDPEIPCYH